MKGAILGLGLAAAAGLACAEDVERFAPDRIASGAAIYEQNCSACHGPHMADPSAAFDLRTFPPQQHARFVRSVTQGKNSMPPWGGLLAAPDIEALWAYVMAGEKQAAGPPAR
jgi:mono/diheme cytochrome c family protein